MSLTVDVLPIEPLPIVRARVDLTGAWALSGRVAEGSSWTVAEGTGPAWLSDPWAPLGVPVSYTLTAGEASWESGPVVRTFRGDDALTDLQGRGVVDFRRGGSGREREPRHGFFDVPGEALQPYLSAPVAGAGSGAMTARVTGPDIDALDALVGRNVPVIVLHNRARCEIPGCRVPLALTVLLTAAPDERTGRVDVAEHVWSLSYRPIPTPWGFMPPVATWADARRVFPTVGDLKASGLTVDELRRGDWLVGW